MKTLLNEEFYPLTAQYGFVKASLDGVVSACVDDLTRRKSWNRPGATCSTSHLRGQISDLLASFDRSEKVQAATESVLLVPCGDWVAWFENGLSSQRTWTRYAPRDLRVQSITLGSSLSKECAEGGLEDWEVRESGRMGQVLFRYDVPRGAKKFWDCRLVKVDYNRREWRWHQSGVELAFEELENYRRNNIKERITSQTLEEYCNHLGVRPFDESFFDGAGVIVRAPASSRDEQLMGETCAEFQDGIPDFVAGEASSYSEA